jgi:hypothetical protein
MTEDEALQIGRVAVESARQRVGDNRKALIAELQSQTERDPKLMEAFAVAGHLIVRAAQEVKH